MSSACHLCTRVLSTPFNLKRHLHLCHNIPISPTASNHKALSGWHQSGGGASSMDGEDTDDDDDDDSEQDDENETDIESGEEENTDDNSVFDRFFKKIDNEQSLAERQKEFREVYGNFLEWLDELKHNKIHRQIMKTARALEMDDDYDRNEALLAAVEKRKFLLDRLVPGYEGEGEEEEEDEMSSEMID